MSDIPKDIMDAAEKAFDAALEAPTFGGEDIQIIAAAIFAERQRDQWQDISTASRGEHILYFPSERNKRGDFKFGPMIKVDRYPVSYPRQPTHWMPLPAAPKGTPT